MSDSHPTSYSYEPLTHGGNIRVLVLEPSLEQDAPLRFTFHQASLEALQGRYDTISYTWGEPLLSYPLHNVNDDGQIIVTKNLDQGLRRIRHRLDQSWLWADAVCINQQDNEEKAVQIPPMADIYRGAKRTIAWLGPGSEELGRGMLCLDQISRQKHNMRPDEIDVVSVSTLINLPYFSRLWIIQEIALSMDITIICGSFEISWLRFSTTLPLFRYRPWMFDETSNHRIRAICQVIGVWQQNKGIEQKEDNISTEILSLLSAFSGFGCADPRDRIFALYSMAQDIKPSVMKDSHSVETKILMDVSYSRDIFTTYRDFALACMLKGNTRDILIAALTRLQFTSSQTWPSWIPDWQNTTHEIEGNSAQSFHLPTVSYTGKQYGNSVQIQVGDVWPPSWAVRSASNPNVGSTAYIKLSAKGAPLSGSFPTFLRSIIDMYKATGNDSTCSLVGLYLVLTKLWCNPSIELKSLTDCLTDYWDLDGSCDTEHLVHHERFIKKPHRPDDASPSILLPPTQSKTALAGGIQKAMRNSCFFSATLKEAQSEDPVVCFGFGDSAVKEGDRIVLSDSLILQTEHHNMYGATVIRAVGTVDHLTWPEVDEGQITYRLVGKACVLVHVKNVSSTIRRGWKRRPMPTTLYLC